MSASNRHPANNPLPRDRDLEKMNPWDWRGDAPPFPLIPFLALVLVGAIIFVVMQ